MVVVLFGRYRFFDIFGFDYCFGCFVFCNFFYIYVIVVVNCCCWSFRCCFSSSRFFDLCFCFCFCCDFGEGFVDYSIIVFGNFNWLFSGCGDFIVDFYGVVFFGIVEVGFLLGFFIEFEDFVGSCYIFIV